MPSLLCNVQTVKKKTHNKNETTPLILILIQNVVSFWDYCITCLYNFSWNGSNVGTEIMKIRDCFDLHFFLHNYVIYLLYVLDKIWLLNVIHSPVDRCSDDERSSFGVENILNSKSMLL